jgi:hypothetical protein
MCTLLFQLPQLCLISRGYLLLQILQIENKMDDDGSETTVEASVQITATEVVSYSLYSVPLPPPPPYEPSSVNYYNGQQISGVRMPYDANSPNVVIIAQPVSSQQVVVEQSNGYPFLWSCIVFWTCGFFFGGIAFILDSKFLNIAC